MNTKNKEFLLHYITINGKLLRLKDDYKKVKLEECALSEMIKTLKIEKDALEIVISLIDSDVS